MARLAADPAGVLKLALIIACRCGVGAGSVFFYEPRRHTVWVSLLTSHSDGG